MASASIAGLLFTCCATVFYLPIVVILQMIASGCYCIIFFKRASLWC